MASANPWQPQAAMVSTYSSAQQSGGPAFSGAPPFVSGFPSGGVDFYGSDEEDTSEQMETILPASEARTLLRFLEREIQTPGSKVHQAIMEARSANANVAPRSTLLPAPAPLPRRSEAEHLPRSGAPEQLPRDRAAEQLPRGRTRETLPQSGAAHDLAVDPLYARDLHPLYLDLCRTKHPEAFPAADPRLRNPQAPVPPEPHSAPQHPLPRRKAQGLDDSTAGDWTLVGRQRPRAEATANRTVIRAASPEQTALLGKPSKVALDRVYQLTSSNGQAWSLNVTTIAKEAGLWDVLSGRISYEDALADSKTMRRLYEQIEAACTSLLTKALGANQAHASFMAKQVTRGNERVPDIPAVWKSLMEANNTRSSETGQQAVMKLFALKYDGMAAPLPYLNDFDTNQEVARLNGHPDQDINAMTTLMVTQIQPAVENSALGDDRHLFWSLLYEFGEHPEFGNLARANKANMLLPGQAHQYLRDRLVATWGRTARGKAATLQSNAVGKPGSARAVADAYCDYCGLHGHLPGPDTCPDYRKGSQTARASHFNKGNGKGKGSGGH